MEKVDVTESVERATFTEGDLTATVFSVKSHFRDADMTSLAAELADGRFDLTRYGRADRRAKFDYSVASLKTLDAILTETRDRLPLLDDMHRWNLGDEKVMQALIFHVGAYIGEVLRNNATFGADWKKSEDLGFDLQTAFGDIPGSQLERYLEWKSADTMDSVENGKARLFVLSAVYQRLRSEQAINLTEYASAVLERGYRDKPHLLDRVTEVRKLNEDLDRKLAKYPGLD